MKSRQIFFENLVAQNALGGIPKDYEFANKTLYQIFEDLFSGPSFGKVTLEENAGLEYNEADELRTKYNTLVPNGTSSQRIGNLSPKAASVWKTKTIVEVLDEILFPAGLPTYIIPTLVLTDTLTPIQEVGTTVTNDLKLTGTKNDAGDFTSLKIFEGVTEIASSNPNPGLTATLNYSRNFQVPVGVTTWEGKGAYNQGDRKNDSQGNPDPRNYALLSTNNPQAANNNFTSNTTSIDGIYPFFYGVSSDIGLTKETIKSEIEAGNSVKQLTKADGTINIEFGDLSSDFVVQWFAHASIYPTKTKWEDTTNSSNKGFISGASDYMSAPQLININSPNGYWNNIQYKVYRSNRKVRVSTPLDFKN